MQSIDYNRHVVCLCIWSWGSSPITHLVYFSKKRIAEQVLWKTVNSKRRYRVSPIIHCCNSTTPYWIRAPPILFYMVPCKEGHLCAFNSLGKHQPLGKRNISFESYEWALFSKVALFTNGSGCVGTILLWRCLKVMRTS